MYYGTVILTEGFCKGKYIAGQADTDKFFNIY